MTEQSAQPRAQTAPPEDADIGRAEAIRAASELQWGRDPAGAVAAGEEELGTPESFAEVERYRYAEQPWMHDTFDYGRFAGQRVLEIGVGLGTDHLQFARAGAKMSGIDLTPRCIELTQRRFEQEGLTSNLQVMDAEQLRFADDSFDVVYSFGVLHHVASTERAFTEVRRVLRPGGVFIGALYNRWSAFMALVMAYRIRHAEWRSESLAERLSRIEYSSSSSDVARPYVRLFSARELKRLLTAAGFEEVGIRRRHLGAEVFERRLPTPAADLLSRTAGWYLVHRAS
jgi:ubiquinone/menaquinone biosynthesis C-methylase UbiE